MGGRIGILAGSGKASLLAIAEMKRRGFVCVVAGIEGEAETDLERASETFEWIRPGDIGRGISFFQTQDIKEVMMIGKVRASFIFGKESFDPFAQRLMAGLKEKSPTSILRAVIEAFEKEGIKILDPSPFLQPYFCGEGFLTQISASVQVRENLEFGLRKARQLADLDIGQTLAVKDMAIVAVEGMEGTDETIQRAGKLAGHGFVVAKVSRTQQDMRMDVPAVGLGTVMSLIQAGGIGLGIEAGRVAFFEQEEALPLAEAKGIPIIVRKL